MVRGVRVDWPDDEGCDGSTSAMTRAACTRIRRILYMLRSARQPRDMDQPGFRLHPLRGEYQGHWSVAVSGNWRIVFRFEAGEAMDVDLVDYH